MYQTWWKVLWSSIYVVIIAVNIAFTFNIVNIVNPTSLLNDYSGYYFGMSSFIDSFKYWFGENDFLQGFWGTLKTLGSTISLMFSKYEDAMKVVSFANSNPAWEIISMLLALVMFTWNIAPMVIMLLMGLLFLLYVAFFMLQCLLFVISFFGGAFATPLPDVYPELALPVS